MHKETNKRMLVSVWPLLILKRGRQPRWFTRNFVWLRLLHWAIASDSIWQSVHIPLLWRLHRLSSLELLRVLGEPQHYLIESSSFARTRLGCLTFLWHNTYSLHLDHLRCNKQKLRIFLRHPLVHRRRSSLFRCARKSPLSWLCFRVVEESIVCVTLRVIATVRVIVVDGRILSFQIKVENIFSLFIDASDQQFAILGDGRLDMDISVEQRRQIQDNALH